MYDLFLRSSRVNWCEKNYHHFDDVAEFYNCYTSTIGGLIAFWLAYECAKHKLRSLAHVLFVTGLFANSVLGYFHHQSLDWRPYIWARLCFTLSFVGLYHWRSAAVTLPQTAISHQSEDESKESAWDWTLTSAHAFSAIFLVYLFENTTVPLFWFHTFFCFVSTAIQCDALCDVLLVSSRLRYSDAGRVQFNIRFASALFALASLMYACDFIFCDVLAIHSWLAEGGYFHAFGWHLFSTIAISQMAIATMQLTVAMRQTSVEGARRKLHETTFFGIFVLDFTFGAPKKKQH